MEIQKKNIEKSPILPLRDLDNVHHAEAAFEKLIETMEQKKLPGSMDPSPTENFDSRPESECTCANKGRQNPGAPIKVNQTLDNLAYSFDRRCFELCQGELAKIFGLDRLVEIS